MTSTDIAPIADPSGQRTGGTARERREAKARRRRATRTTVAVTVVVAVTLGGGGLAWYATSTTEDLADQNAAAKALLTESDGKVAEQSPRDALSVQIEATEALLDEPFLTRLVRGTSGRRDALAAASDGVRASMVELARAQVVQARAGLETAEARAQKYYDASEGLGVDAGVRAQLRGALDTTASADEAADRSLAGTDLAELEKAAYDLSANRSVVTLATDTLAEAQDAITCPEVDQVWHPDSGRVPAEDLAPIPWASDHMVRADVLDGLIELDAAYREAFGEHLTINSSYRSYEAQASLYDPSSPIAAAPGCSNHGLGLAVDIGGGVETFDTEQYTWLKENARAFGWMHPAFAEPDGRVPEPWHWESVLAREDA
ncbi:M15 family metallopeptidase [Promicromonospora sp. NPDC052451]|uniref:M15 family metallopeptidase n=1 Tax=Promicromonospora sp. NPDC052451 TaxID=3364407 RepID=UPI0037C7655E